MSETGPHCEETIPLADLHYANGRPDGRAVLKSRMADFQVDEELGFELTGAGEHVYVRVKKIDLTTPQTARRLAEATGVPLRDIGYSGMKDRRGECTQWFSVKYPAHDAPRLGRFENDHVAIIDQRRNHRKLKVGSHRRNRFRLLLRDCQGPPGEFEQRLQALRARGVPNYFGAQRFGHDLANIHQVRALMASPTDAARRHPGRQRRGMLLSAARAYLFNQVLSRRIQQGDWARYIEGDVLNLDDTARYFLPEAGWDETLQQRLDSFDIHVSGPLAGRLDGKDKYTARRRAADMEKAVLNEFPTLLAGLQAAGLRASRRPLRYRVRDLSWQWLEPQGQRHLQLQFVLPRGAYATSLLRELCMTDQPQREQQH